MKYYRLIWPNLAHHKLRAVLMLCSIAAGFLLFGILMTVRQTFLVGGNIPAAQLLLLTSRHPGALTPSVEGHVDKFPGVLHTLGVAAGAFYFRNQNNSLVVAALNPVDYFKVFPDAAVPVAQRLSWMTDETGAVVQQIVAARLHWKLGEKIPLISYPGAASDKALYVTIDGFQEQHGGISFGDIYIHASYFSAWRGTDSYAELIVQPENEAKSSGLARRIDSHFANSSTPTYTRPIGVFIRSFLSRFGDVSQLTMLLASVALAAMIVILATTIARSVRERTEQHAVMKVLGYTGTQLFTMVLIETSTLVAVGGAIGLAVATALIHMTRTVSAQFLPGLHPVPSTLALSLASMAVTTVVVSALPALWAARLKPTNLVWRE